MRETLLKCDICKEYVDELYAIDIENPVRFGDGKRIETLFREVPVGRITVDNVWETECCRNCMAKMDFRCLFDIHND